MAVKGPSLIAVLFVTALLASCHKPPPPKPAPPVSSDALDQGWSKADVKAWSETSQGSRLLPLAWADALETADSETIFFSASNMARFGYLAPPEGASSALPTGFVEDKADDTKFARTKLRWFAGQGSQEPWLGMTCAACHTGEITYKGAHLRVQGGPALADYQGFIEGFVAALHATRANAAKWDRFARRVLPQDTPENRASLTSAFDSVMTFEDRSLAMNRTDLRYGFGRLDAVGHILNRVTQLADAKAPGNPSDAPVSYPFIWNTSQSDRVQWNGIAQNKRVGPVDIGALGRNVGEVTGVFADVVFTKSALPTAYVSSAQVRNLIALENLLARLKPPAWPQAVLGVPDAALVSEGKTLFAARCSGCHTHLDRTDVTTAFKTTMVLFTPRSPGEKPPGTDIWMACNAYINRAPTGVLQGALRRGETLTAPRTPLGRSDYARNMLVVSVERTLLGKADEIVAGAIDSWFGVDATSRMMLATAESVRDQRRRECETTREKGDHPTLGYKARPLTGIWATAPYLHNGSVPTLYDLLLPEDKRPASFSVGSREFDPVKVGFVADAAGAGFRLETQKDGAAIDGNANAGHDYDNASLTDAQRKALVEYMKTL